MGAGSGKLQDEEVFFFLIDEQPVRFYVEFPVLLPLPLQLMVAQGDWKLQVSCEASDYFIQFPYILTTLDGKLVLFLEFIRPANLALVLRSAHFFNSAKASSTLS